MLKPELETALLSEAALAEDWNRPEEDDAWANLQEGDGDGENLPQIYTDERR